MKAKNLKPGLYMVCAALLLAIPACHRTTEPISYCDTINSATTWSNHRDGLDYIISCSISVESALTIEAGTEIEFTSGAGIIVENTGSIVAIGTLADAIIMRGSTDAQGAWKGIFIKSDNVNNALKYCQISGGGQSSFDGHTDWKANLRVTLDAQVKLQNSTFSKSGKDGIYTEGLDNDERNPVSEFWWNSFIDNANYPISTLAATVNVMDGTGSVYTGNGKNIIDVRGGRMYGDHVWKAASVPYLISGYAIAGYYTNVGNLTVSPGVTIQFAADQGLAVGEYSSGYISMVGTAANRITLTGETALPGAWKGICFNSTNVNNRLSFVDISYGGSSSFTGNTTHLANISMGGFSAGGATIDNSTITNSAAYGIFVAQGSTEPTVTNCTYSGNASGDYFVEP